MGAERIIDLDELINDSDLFYKKLNSYIKSSIKNYDKRHKLITIKLNNTIYRDFTIANFITQMVLCIPFVDLKVPIKDEFVILEEIKSFNKGTLTMYFNKIIYYFNSILNYNFIDDLNMSLKKIINIFSDISGKCNIYSGTTINLRDILLLYKKDKDFRKEFNKKVPPNLDFSQIDETINNQFTYLINKLSITKNCYQPYFVSNAGINKKQFKEVISKIGLKADLDGKIIPYVINTNYLIGLGNITEYYIVSKLSRKALITSHKEVKKSGYLNRKLELLLIDTFLSNEIDDCHSDEYVNIEIDCKDTAKRYNFRYYLDEKTNKLKRFNFNDYKKYIGKVLKFRSPIKCKSKDGKICKKCYGDLSKVNYDIHIGILAELLICEPFTQTLLSAKHLQQVITNIIKWGDKFLEYFIIDKGSIICDSSKEKSGIQIILNESDYENSEDEEGEKIIISSFSIRYKNGKEDFITIPQEIKLNPTEKLESYLTENVNRSDNNISETVIPFKTLCADDRPIFSFALDNNELSKSLREVIDLIEKPDHLGIDEIDMFTNKFIQLLNDGNVDLSAVHAELIVRNLIRRKNNLTERPERFDRQDDPEDPDNYTILKVSDAVFHGPPAVAMSFEKLKQLIQSPTLYTRKGKSILDNVYFG